MKRYFLLRVELHELPKAVDSRPIYEKLHDELLGRNFYKHVAGSNGKTYELPDGVYQSFTEQPATVFNGLNARSFAVEAIDETVAFVKQDHPTTTLWGTLLVVEIAGSEEYWRGLNQVS